MTADRSGQLVLSLTPARSLSAEDFVIGAANEAARRAIDAFAGPEDRFLLLLGPPGSGKTHLAAIWAARESATALEPGAPARWPHPPGRGAALVLDDADRVEDERALFDLVEGVRAASARLLLVARAAPERWALATPDMGSRLKAMPRAVLGPPDDTLIATILVKHFADRGLSVTPDLIDYLVTRMQRSYAEAGALVEALDRAALGRGRGISRALAREVLAARDGVI